ncbi:MAG: hypothetical protein OER12_10570 [Acidimicrobiia bacterium]|nr:hypothetical protein [Acidimicrobiia bacterium]
MSRFAFFLSAVVGLAACTTGVAQEPAPPASSTTTTVAPTTTTTTTTIPPTTTTTIPVFDLAGSVLTPDGLPLTAAQVSIGEASTTTAADGSFVLAGVPAGTVTISRPAHHSVEVPWTGAARVDVSLEPRVVRALRVSKYVAADPEAFAGLLDLAANSMVNSLVFDTKDESGYVLYETAVPQAAELGSIGVMYDVGERLAQAKAAGLYTITRVVSFEDQVWVRADPEAKFAGRWIDPRDPENWEYPLGLAVEACELGFDEIQFDYVRFPAGQTAVSSNVTNPTTQEERLAAISGYLTEARDRLHPLGCALSADIFGIVVSTANDQGIGQRPEEVSAVVDAVSPMVYPSHYSDGWLGFEDPNDYPGPVTANALDSGIPRLNSPSVMRPWLQAFYYSSSQIQATIAEAEKRGVGWILWNAGGNYAESALPKEPG